MHIEGNSAINDFTCCLNAKCTFNLVDVVGVVGFQRYNGTNAKKEEEKYAMSVLFFLKGGTNSFCRKHFPYKLLKMRASSCTDLPDKCSKMNTVPA